MCHRYSARSHGALPGRPWSDRVGDHPRFGIGEDRRRDWARALPTPIFRIDSRTGNCFLITDCRPEIVETSNALQLMRSIGLDV